MKIRSFVEDPEVPKSKGSQRSCWVTRARTKITKENKNSNSRDLCSSLVSLLTRARCLIDSRLASRSRSSVSRELSALVDLTGGVSDWFMSMRTNEDDRKEEDVPVASAYCAAYYFASKLVGR